MDTTQIIVAVIGAFAVFTGGYLSRRTTKDVEEGKSVLSQTTTAIDAFDRLSARQDATIARQAQDLKDERAANVLADAEIAAQALVIRTRDAEIARLKRQLSAERRKKK